MPVLPRHQRHHCLGWHGVRQSLRHGRHVSGRFPAAVRRRGQLVPQTAAARVRHRRVRHARRPGGRHPTVLGRAENGVQVVQRRQSRFSGR